MRNDKVGCHAQQPHPPNGIDALTGEPLLPAISVELVAVPARVNRIDMEDLKELQR